MKKLLILLLVFVLTLGFGGCGNGDENPNDAEGNDTVIEENEGGESGEENEGGDSVTPGPGDQLDPDDLTMVDDPMEGNYDFGFDAADSFGFSSVVEKMDYSDISALASEVEERLHTVAEAVLGAEFEVFSTYEEVEEDDIDQLSYAIAMENDDTESRYLEGGAYHNQADGKHYQYVMVATENFYEVNDANIESALETLEDALGITVSKSTLKKAAEKAFKTATDTEDYYSLMDSQIVKGSGFAELIKISVDAFATEENEIGYYVSAERERCYE